MIVLISYKLAIMMFVDAEKRRIHGGLTRLTKKLINRKVL
jgi:hypothetical protein